MPFEFKFKTTLFTHLNVSVVQTAAFCSILWLLVSLISLGMIIGEILFDSIALFRGVVTDCLRTAHFLSDGWNIVECVGLCVFYSLYIC